MTEEIMDDLAIVAAESIHVVLCDGDAFGAAAIAEATFRECYRVLKPGGFLFAFAAPQSFHRVAAALEGSMPLGQFEMRDAITWVHGAHDTSGHGLSGRASLISMAQKAKTGTFVDNWESHEVGLIDTRVKWKGKVPSNVIDGEGSGRVEIATHLLRVFGRQGCAVLDPLMTSEDFIAAASSAGARFVGARIRAGQPVAA